MMTYWKGHGRIRKESCSYIPRHNCWWCATIQTCCYKRHCPHARKLDEGEEDRRGLGEAHPHLVTAWSNMSHISFGLGLQFVERYINVIDMNTLVQIHVCIFCYIFCIMWQLRGHVNKNKTLEVGGWVKWPIGNKKKWKIHFYTLFYYVFGRAFEHQ